MFLLIRLVRFGTRRVADAHANADQSLQRSVRIVDHIEVKLDNARFEEEEERRAAELEVSELLGALDALACFARDDRAADHHGSHTNDHDAAVGGGVDGDDVADVFAVDVEGGADGHGVDGVVLALDEFGLAHDAVNGDMEAVVVLWSKAHDAESATVVAFGVLGIGFAKEAFDAEFATFDPDALGVFHAVEDDGAAVCGADDDVWVVRG